MTDDPICGICGERLSTHVPTEAGPYTHPKEARGEGVYRMVRPGYTMGRGPADDDIEMPPRYEFVPNPPKPHVSALLWRPGDELCLSV